MTLENIHLIFPLSSSFPTENFQSTPNFGTESTLQPSLPVLNNSTPSGMVCNYTSLSFPPVSSAWLLTSASSTSLQPLMGSDYLNPNSSTTMLTMLNDQSQDSNSTLSCPGILEWNITGSTDRRATALQEFNISWTPQCPYLHQSSVIKFQIEMPQHFLSNIVCYLYSGHTTCGAKSRIQPGTFIPGGQPDILLWAQQPGTSDTWGTQTMPSGLWLCFFP